MKVRHWIVSLTLALLGASSWAVTQHLGTLDAEGSDFDQVFWRFFGAGSQVGSFVDYYTFSLVAPATGATGGANVDFEWGLVNLDLTSVSLFNGGGLLLGNSAPTSFSFNGLGAGDYKLAVAGSFNGVLGTAGYSGTIRSIASAAPEADSLAMALLGLAGVAAVVRRRKA